MGGESLFYRVKIKIRSDKSRERSVSIGIEKKSLKIFFIDL